MTADRSSTTDEVSTWADALAASLPPMTTAESAAAGRLAATLDARRAAAGQQLATTPPRSATKPNAKAPISRVA